MKIRFTEYQGELYVVLGQIEVEIYDPPDCYVAVLLKNSIFESVIQYQVRVLPIQDTIEVTDLSKMLVISILYDR